MRFLLLVVISAFSLALTSFADAPRANAWSVLWVIDNSGSMQDQRETLIRALPHFFAQLKARGVAKFDMAVTTTDYFTHKGALVANEGLKIVTQDLANPENALASLISKIQDTSTSFWEQGLESSLSALKTEGESFLKEGQPLAIVYFSDEDDYSCSNNCTGVEPENNPDWEAHDVSRYELFLATKLMAKKIVTRVYPVIGMANGSCEVPSYGLRYSEFRGWAGGTDGSICKSEIGKSLKSIATHMTGAAIEPPSVLVNPIPLTARAGQEFWTSLTPYVGGTGYLTFTKTNGPAWISVSAHGNLTATPSPEDIGTSTFQVTVCDETPTCVAMSVMMTVVKANEPPVWKLSNPLILKPFKATYWRVISLVNGVYDPDGGIVRCAALAMPAWFTMTSNCVFRGQPQEKDIGPFEMKVRAIDSHGEHSTLRIQSSVIK